MKSPALRRIQILIGIVATALVTSRGAYAGVRRPPRPPPTLLAHYMPWFQAKPISPQWGWHWTMNHFDPDHRVDHRRSIASYYTPLIGPYDSSDPAVLEYHALLMKIAGIDGVIIDWYGTTDFWDYGLIHRNALRLVDVLKRLHLRWAVCYEDQSIKHKVESGAIRREQALDEGWKDLRWLEEHWFSEPLYVKWKGAPLLLDFGPQYFTSEQWQGLLSRFAKPPAFFTLNAGRPPAVGAFAWPPMSLATGKTLSDARLDGYLRQFYGRPEPRIAAAFPGFHDIYGEAGVRPSYAILNAYGGKTFEQTLALALASGSPIVQLVTWNDFGEGTNIEPARRYGYRYLETIQKYERKVRRGSFLYRRADLRLPLRIYRLRKRASTATTQQALDRIVQLLVRGQLARARTLLAQTEMEGRLRPASRRQIPLVGR